MKLSNINLLVLFIPAVLAQVGNAVTDSSSLTSTSGSLDAKASTSVDTSASNVFQTTFSLTISPFVTATSIDSTGTTSLPLPSFSRNTSLSTASETPKSGAKSLAVETKHMMIGLAAIVLGYFI